jgi:hypothetical protein
VDLNAFGNMLSGILRVGAFRSNGSSQEFRKKVVTPLMKKGGPRPGAVARIRELMDKLIVKHQ